MDVEFVSVRLSDPTRGGLEEFGRVSQLQLRLQALAKGVEILPSQAHHLRNAWGRVADGDEAQRVRFGFGERLERCRFVHRLFGKRLF